MRARRLRAARSAQPPSRLGCVVVVDVEVEVVDDVVVVVVVVVEVGAGAVGASSPRT